MVGPPFARAHNIDEEGAQRVRAVLREWEESHSVVVFDAKQRCFVRREGRFPRFRGVHRHLAETTFAAGVKDPSVKRKGRPWLTNLSDRSAQVRLGTVAVGIRGGRKIDEQVGKLVGLFEDWGGSVLLGAPPAEWPRGARARVAALEFRTRWVLRECRKRGLWPVGTQVPVGAGTRSGGNIATAVDMVFVDACAPHEKLILMELKADRRPWFRGAAHMRGRWRAVVDTWKNRHLLQLAWTRALAARSLLQWWRARADREGDWPCVPSGVTGELWRVTDGVYMFAENPEFFARAAGCL